MIDGSGFPPWQRLLPKTSGLFKALRRTHEPQKKTLRKACEPSTIGGLVVDLHCCKANHKPIEAIHGSMVYTTYAKIGDDGSIVLY